jgi:predicted Zn-dependent peptidase
MYEKITLPNGVRILTEPVEGIRSAAIGVFVATGSREESASENGAAHFIEHMVFKGSQAQSAAVLAQRMDAVGGQVNAYTTKECTCFYAHVLDSHLMEALDILTELVFEAKFDQADVETERGVILEEIGMYRDTPDDLVSEILMKKIYKGSSLARPILGTPATLKNMTGDSLKAYQKAHYLPEKMIVSLAGSFSPDVVEEITRRFSAVEPGKTVRQKQAVYHPAIALKKKAIEQNHLILAFPSIPQASEKKYGMQLLSSMLGGGMSSRLFQEVREKKGLCYTVASYGSCYADTGVFCVYTALNKEMETLALETIGETIAVFTRDGVSQEELDRAREQSKANVLMGLESTTSRMHYMARSELTGEKILTPDEIIAAYDGVTAEEIQALAKETFDFQQASLSAVGRVAEESRYQELLSRFY